MSLDFKQRAAVRDEFAANLRRSGLRVDEVEHDLGFTSRRLRAALRLKMPTTGADIWLVRDYLEQAVLDSGGDPVEYTVLTESSRALARNWFTLVPAPRHAFPAHTREQ